MITRLVKLKFKEESYVKFLRLFEHIKLSIKSQEGCLELNLLSSDEKYTLYTWSRWVSEDDLNAYRKSDFFGSYWPDVKKMLRSKPEAKSFNIEDRINP